MIHIHSERCRVLYSRLTCGMTMSLLLATGARKNNLQYVLACTQALWRWVRLAGESAPRCVGALSLEIGHPSTWEASAVQTHEMDWRAVCSDPVIELAYPSSRPCQ
jgi:hypothetical protein